MPGVQHPRPLSGNPGNRLDVQIEGANRTFEGSRQHLRGANQRQPFEDLDSLVKHCDRTRTDKLET